MPTSILLAAAIVSNGVPNASFEAGVAPHGVIVSWPFVVEAARPVVSLDGTTAAHGSKSLKIDASRGGSYEFLTPDVDLPSNRVVVTISAFVKADRPAELRLGAFGYDREVRGCREAGLEPMFLFASHGIFVSSPWDDGRFADWYIRKDSAPAATGPFGHRRYYLPRMEDWRDFITASVTRYARDIRYWEVVNEPNILMSSAAAYADYAREAYRTVKLLKPDAAVVGLCVTGDLGANPGSFLAQAEETDAFVSMDVASFHPYESLLDYGKRKAEDAIADMRAIVDRHRPGLPIIQNELYYLYVDKADARRLPAHNVVRRFAIDMGMGLAVSAPMAFDSHLGVDAGHRGSLLPGRVATRFTPNEIYVASAASRTSYTTPTRTTPRSARTFGRRERRLAGASARLSCGGRRSGGSCLFSRNTLRAADASSSGGSPS